MLSYDSLQPDALKNGLTIEEHPSTLDLVLDVGHRVGDLERVLDQLYAATAALLRLTKNSRYWSPITGILCNSVLTSSTS